MVKLAGDTLFLSFSCCILYAMERCFLHWCLHNEEFLTPLVFYPGTLLCVLGYVSALTVSVLDKMGIK